MNMLICPQCGTTFKEGANFCHICGYRVPEESVHPAEEPIKEQPEPEKKAEPIEEPINVETFTEVKTDEVFEAVKSGNIFKRAINIMFKPRQEWEAVAKEQPRIPMLILGYALIFSVIPLFSLIVGYGLVGERNIYFFDYYWNTSLLKGIVNGTIFLIATFAAIIFSSIIVNMLAPSFKTEKNLGRAMQLITYSFTPMFFGGALFIIPLLSFLVYLIGLYGVFILLIGLPIILKTPKNTQIGYFFTSIGLLYGIFFSVYWIFKTIFWAIFFAVGSIL